MLEYEYGWIIYASEIAPCTFASDIINYLQVLHEWNIVFFTKFFLPGQQNYANSSDAV